MASTVSLAIRGLYLSAGAILLLLLVSYPAVIAMRKEQRDGLDIRVIGLFLIVLTLFVVGLVVAASSFVVHTISR